MHDYLFTAEVVRFAFVLGVAVSMMLYERRHLTTGSIVVPGYMATFVVYPLIIAATALNAFVSYVIVNKLLCRRFLLYGRTKFTVLALVSITIQTVMLKLSPSGAWLWESDIKLFVGVGYVVPALIAHDMGRQGIKKTLGSVCLATVIVVIPIGLALLFGLPGVNDLAPLQGAGRMAIDAGWIPIAVILSAGAAWGISHNYGLRSGGFMGAAFIAILLGDPWQVAIAIALAATTYTIVTRLLMDEMILFGRRKFSAMLVISSMMSWTLLWFGRDLLGIAALQHFDVGALALTPLIVPGLLANDAQRTSVGRVSGGLGLATAFVLSTTWWLQSIIAGLRLETGWKLVSVVTFIGIFWHQLVPTRVGVPTRVLDIPRPRQSDRLAVDFDFDFDFSPTGYRRWADTHREAAAAAEHWLAYMTSDAPLPSIWATEDDLLLLTTRASTLKPPRTDLTDAGRFDTIRIAAGRALSAGGSLPRQSDAERTHTPALLPRRPDRPRVEFAEISLDIAASVARPAHRPPTLGNEIRRPLPRSAARVAPDGIVRHDRAETAPAATNRDQAARRRVEAVPVA